MPDVVLGVLDQSPIPEGSTGPHALANTVDLARLVDSLGFHRYWVAEHHATPALAGPSPEVLIGPVAAATKQLRVGSGGVMLPHYSPLKVAESFSVLCGLFPGRIDLGIGRAPGTDPETMYALQRDRRQASPNDFPDQLAELLAYLNDDFPEYCDGKPHAAKAIGNSPVTLHLEVPDTDAAIARAAAAGATVTMPAMDMFWGDRYGKVSDPFGHLWSFSTPLKK